MAKKPTLAPAEVYAAPRRRGSRVPTYAWLVLMLVATFVGFFVGHYVMADPVSFGELRGTTTITEAQLDKTVATYVLDGETYKVSARDAIAQGSSLDAVRNSDGTYLMPSAENVLAAARTAILMREVEARGIEVSDEEYVAYVEDTFGTTSADELAVAYNMDVETVRARLRESAAIAKLRQEVVSADESELAPPVNPDEDAQDVPTADYAAYIIGLAGDEWDSEKGIWASEDGPFASALREYDIRSDAATYEAAQTAYNVAYQLQSAKVTAAATQWTDFVNALLCEASLALSSIVS